jgi:hypothetical protein
VFLYVGEKPSRPFIRRLGGFVDMATVIHPSDRLWQSIRAVFLYASFSLLLALVW